jgi:hypothetical protein
LDETVLDARFPRYTAHHPAIPVWNLTPELGGCIVRFFDTPAISPSGRYVATFRLPFEDRLPNPGERGGIVLIDLLEGKPRVVAETCGWEPQLGANVNWGGSDDVLLFSDVDTQSWEPFTVKLNPHTGVRQRLNGPIYHVSPDRKWIVGTNPRAMCRTQKGYGVVVPAEHVPIRRGAPADDGVWLTSADTGEVRLLHSLAGVVERFGDQLGIECVDDWAVYAFHSKFAPSGDRMLFTLRYCRADFDPSREALVHERESGLRYAIVTCRPDGSELALAIGPEAWIHGGHHINFFPDGNTLSMNLGGFADPPRRLRFVQCPAAGGVLRPILPDVRGSGHPTVHPSAGHLLTDCYTGEGWTGDDGTTPLRWIDLRSGREREIVRFHSVTQSPLSTLRADPHPCWDRTWQFITFTTFEGGTRRVFLADMRPLLGGRD